MKTRWKLQRLVNISFVALLTALPLTWYYCTQTPTLQRAIARPGVANFHRVVSDNANVTSTPQHTAAAVASTPTSTLILCPPPHQTLRDGVAHYYTANFSAFNYIYTFYQLRSSNAHGNNEQAFAAFTEVSLLHEFHRLAMVHSAERGYHVIDAEAIRKSVRAHHITCHWTYDNGLHSNTAGSLRQHDGNEWLLRCPHPVHATRLTPSKLQLTFTPPADDEMSKLYNAEAFTVDLPLCRYQSRPRLSTLCAPPAGLPVTAAHMLQWIDYHLFVGIDHVLVYDRSDVYYDALQPYIDAGLVEWISWPFAGSQLFGVHHYADQTHALLDCIQRTQDYSEFVVAIDPDEALSFYSNTTIIAPPVIDQQSKTVVDSMWLRWLRAVEDHYAQSATTEGVINHFLLSSYDFFTQTHASEQLFVDRYQSRRLVNNPSRPKQVLRPGAVKDIAVHDAKMSGRGTRLIMWDYHLPNEEKWRFPQQIITREQADATPQHQALRVNHYINMITNRTEQLLQPGGAGLEQTYNMETEFIHDDQMQLVTRQLRLCQASDDWRRLLQRSHG